LAQPRYGISIGGGRLKILGYDITKAKGNTKAPEKAVGFVGLRASSGFVEEEFISNLRWPDAGKVYQEMSSNDPVIGGCLYLIETLIRRANWHVKLPEGADDSSMDEWKVFIEQCMDDMDISWDAFISEVLSMLTYGFSFHEIVYKTRRGPMEKDHKFRSKYTDGKIGWQKMPIRSQATLKEWEFDGATGEALYFIQDISEGAIVGGGNEPKIPIEDNLLFRTKESRGNPEGQSLLRRAYRPWYFKKYIEELEGIGIERHLAGIPMLQPDEDTPLFDPDDPRMVNLLDWATELVNGLRQDRNHGLVLPFGWQLKLLSPEGGNQGLNTDTVIHRHENRIAITMLADLILLGGDRTGSFALADTKKSLLIRAIESICGTICAQLNKVAVPKLLILNGVTDLTNMPMIVADAIEEPTLKDIALILRAANIDITKNSELFNFIMKVANAPELKEEEILLLAREMGGDQHEENDLINPNGNPEDGPREQDTVENDLK